MSHFLAGANSNGIDMEIPEEDCLMTIKEEPLDDYEAFSFYNFPMKRENLDDERDIVDNQEESSAVSENELGPPFKKKRKVGRDLKTAKMTTKNDIDIKITSIMLTCVVFDRNLICKTVVYIGLEVT